MTDALPNSIIRVGTCQWKEIGTLPPTQLVAHPLDGQMIMGPHVPLLSRWVDGNGGMKLTN